MALQPCEVEEASATLAGGSGRRRKTLQSEAIAKRSGPLDVHRPFAESTDDANVPLPSLFHAAVDTVPLNKNKFICFERSK